jgi:hypothetical protein
VSPSGAGLHWPTLDVDFNLPALVAAVFGSQAWMVSRKESQPGRGTRKAVSHASTPRRLAGRARGSPRLRAGRGPRNDS